MQKGNPAGQRLVAGRYAVLDELGRGGVGVVWRAQDQVIGRQVALKELRIPPGLGPSEHDLFVQRVLREARTAGALSDPAIVTVYDVVPEGGAMYIVMELINATTLAELVASGPLSEQRATELGLQVLSALETAHAAGIVHRDVKPSNIMVLADDRVKLADFGIAQAMDDPSLTATGGIMGSPGYMAPELFHGDPPSPATDLWSLGATLFHVVEGRAPFQRDSTAATMHAIMYDDPQLRRCHGPLAAVIMGLLVHAPDKRLTAAGVRSQLASATTRAVSTTDVERTDVLPRITAAAGAEQADQTALVDRDRTTTVSRHPRSTRPWDAAREADEFTEVVPTAMAVDPASLDSVWGPERGGRRRRVLLVGATVVVVLALVGVAIALTGSKPNAVAAPPVRTTVSNTPDATVTASPTPSATPTTAPSTTSAAVTTTTTATKTRSSPTHQAGNPMPPAPPAPGTTANNLTYIGIARYNSPSGFHITLTDGSPVPAGFVEEGPLGYLVTTNAPGTVKFYECKVSNSGDYFSSVDQSGHCEGQSTVALLGYIYADQPATGQSAALYRCNSGSSHYDSLNPDCENNGKQEGRNGFVI